MKVIISKKALAEALMRASFTPEAAGAVWIRPHVLRGEVISHDGKYVRIRVPSFTADLYASDVDVSESAPQRVRRSVKRVGAVPRPKRIRR